MTTPYRTPVPPREGPVSARCVFLRLIAGLLLTGTLLGLLVRFLTPRPVITCAPWCELFVSEPDAQHRLTGTCVCP